MIQYETAVKADCLWGYIFTLLYALLSLRVSCIMLVGYPQRALSKSLHLSLSFQARGFESRTRVVVVVRTYIVYAVFCRCWSNEIFVLFMFQFGFEEEKKMHVKSRGNHHDARSTCSYANCEKQFSILPMPRPSETTGLLMI